MFALSVSTRTLRLSSSLPLFLYNVMQTYIAASLQAMGIEYSLYL